MDDIEKVNERRKGLGLNTMDKQIAIMRKQVKRENQPPSADFAVRQQEFKDWRKSVGWIP